MSTNREEAVEKKNEGNKFADVGNYRDAIPLYKEAQRLDPTYAIAYFNCGIAFRKIGMLDEAIKELTDAILCDPNDKDSYYWRGKSYKEKGNRQEAIKDFDKAIKLDPTFGDAYFERATVSDISTVEEVHFVVDNYYQKALEYCNYTDVQKALTYYNMGVSYSTNECWGHAYANFCTAVELDPTVPTYFVQKYLMLWGMNDGRPNRDEPVKILTAASKACKEAIGVLKNKAVRTEREEKQLIEAEAHLNKIEAQINALNI